MIIQNQTQETNSLDNIIITVLRIVMVKKVIDNFMAIMNTKPS